MWGTHPIAPRISPGKTWEGFGSGLVVGTFAVWFAGLYMDWISGAQSLILGVVICLASFLGDLFESMLKRDAQAKDSGKLLLGHGGVLDRFDALLFSAVAAYFLTTWLVY
jgi:phosphatidate cytidylyltransferase